MSIRTVIGMGVLVGSLALAGETPATPTADTAPAVKPAVGSGSSGTGRLERWVAELPSWLKLGAEVRGRSDNYLGLNGVSGRDNSYYLHRLRLNATISLAPWLRLVAQAQDAREVGYDREPVPYTVANPLDLRQGYVEAGASGNEAPWRVRVGRQPLVFGDMRLVSTSNWGNVGPNFDAVRLSLRQPGVRLDAFASLVGVPCAGFDRPRQDKMLSGFYSSFDIPRAPVTVDGYVFWKKNRQSVDLFTYGLRSAGKIPGNFDYTAEFALQRGRVTGQTAAAWAGHGELGYKFAVPRGSVRMAVEYNYATGDERPGDGRYQSFDQLYPTNVYGTAADFGWRNLHEPAASLEWQPDRKTKVKTVYHAFWLAQRQDALYTLTGAIFVSNPSATQNRVGEEIDVRWIRQMGKNLQLWVGYAHLFPGPYLKEAGRDAVGYPYAMWTFSF
ncbi:MAG: alginate export family protein [Acidobacteriia bacterium]|nr:alginate export family protein [Terriglobia bacterium]